MCELHVASVSYGNRGFFATTSFVIKNVQFRPVNCTMSFIIALLTRWLSLY